MGEHLDLDALLVDGDEEEREPSCTFTLGGREWACRDPDDVPFDVVAKLFGKMEDDRSSLVAIEPFFRGVLVPEDVDDFVALLADPNSPITLRTIRPLIEHVATNVLGRPTRRSRRSSAGSQQKDRISTVA